MSLSLSFHLSPLIRLSFFLSLLVTSLSLCSSLFLFSVSCQLSHSLFNDDDNDRSSSWLSLYSRPLQCQSAWAVPPPCLAKKKTRSMQDKFNNVFRPDLLPLEVKWARKCTWKELRFAQDECVVRNPGCCFLDERPCCSCPGCAEVQLSIS